MALLRLYTNEHITPLLAHTLRGRGFDAVSVFDVGMEERSDPEQLAYAVAEGRAVLSFNARDFAPLHDQYLAEGWEHSGIILSTQVPFAELLRRTINLLNSVSAEEMNNRLEWLNSYR
jgi:predicted nuclease of predicted toxin-antitoxin system